MSIPTLSDAELRSLVRWSEEFCDRAQAELDRRERRREQRREAGGELLTAGGITHSYLRGRWE